MALNICTHEQNSNQIESVVCIDEEHTIEEVLEEAAGKFDEKHRVVKVVNANGDILAFWYSDKTLDAALKVCDCMMQYVVVKIPRGLIKEKYVCFPKVNECTIRYAALLKNKTDREPLFRGKDVLAYGLPYRSCESIENQEAVLYLQEDDFSIFNAIGIYNEQCRLLAEIHKLRGRGVRILMVDVPRVEDISRELTEDEKLRIRNNIIALAVPKEPDDEIERQLKKVYGEEDYNLYRTKKIANIRAFYRGYECILEDLEGEFSNVAGGCRVTTDAPNRYKNLVNFLGPCIVGAMYCKDSETIPSVIQRLLNDKYPEEYLAVNYGTCGYYRSYLEQLDKLLVKQGDLIVIIDFFCHIKKYQPEYYRQIDIDLAGLYNVEKDLFFEAPAHMGAKGNQAVAEYIYPYIERMCDDKRQREEIVKNITIRPNVQHSDIDLRFYLDDSERLEKEYGLSGKRNGAIVMNCNPFTNGHKYLIDVARRQVDNLIVFVVEEDKSYFRFKDRKKMVELGTEEFDNVIVLSSGNFVLSSLTMPEYFRKDSLQEVLVNPAKDVEIFAQDIAPIFHISHRFVGEEPIDKVTAQYNKSIKEICPLYGVKVSEIPRAKNARGRGISASKVRELMRNGCYEEIKEMVPETTWKYLIAEERTL